MYENKTVDNINQEMLTSIPDEYEKTLGNPTADIIKSFAIESNSIWVGLQALFNKVDVDKLEGEELTSYVTQRKGIDRKIATFSNAALTIVGNGNIVVGNLFATANGLQFRSLQNITVANTAIVTVQALDAGNNGNVGANAINQMPVTIAGIVSCNNLLASFDGFEAETDDLLRERYYEALRMPATSGNRFHYMKWAKEIVGVGDAKVISLWNGANTVKVIIIDSNKQPASVDVVKKSQDYIDPAITGTGEGEAPIGAYCTVVSAISKSINIDLVDIQEATNYTLAEITETLKTNITEYLKEVAFKQDYISYAKIGNVILNTKGVEDYSNLKINGGIENISIANEEVAVVGAINVI
ncbi:baseplate J/gp47 family protein [Clostridium sp. CF012]|uniref:baseplate J/gp47 family protein n=1 Tax=Clostridium sp. CF012 TaxID=2843319 RepID=UPI001C0E790E|nr:baseplate J/gp47 family protein [Clostridium sp. CF012]MBU3146903.1 baseplate J/gp47 family protein [Clostridium sp. CF012]